MGNKTAKPKPPSTSASTPGDGIRSMETSTLFRTLNFELYMRPNKGIMAFGIGTMSAITLYFAYQHATTGICYGNI